MSYTKCYLSEVGHNNFFYPTKFTALIPDGCEYTILPWVGGKDKKLTPIKIKKCRTFKYESTTRSPRHHRGMDR